MKQLLAILIFFSTVVQAQDAQVLYKLVELPRTLNSRYHESAPLVTPDNQRLYFTVSNHPGNNAGTDNSQDIWYADKQADGSWGKAIHMESPLNNRKFNQVLTILDDGNTLFVRGGNRKKEEGFSLVFKDGSKWDRPEELEIKDFEEMNNGRFSGAAISQDRSAIVIYMNERSEKPYSDLYVSKRLGDGTYSRPRKIPGISTYKDEFGPYLSENDEVMYYASNRDGTIGGVDIWKTRRLDDSWLKWSEPENIGPPINTGGFDSYFSIDSTGQNAFTTRTYVSADGSNMNIYGLVPKAKIIVEGQVLDSETKQPVDLLLSIQAPDEKLQNIQTGKQGKYSFTTYQDKAYKFGGTAVGYEQVQDQIDLTGIETDTTIKKNVFIKPVKAEIILNGYITDVVSKLPANAYMVVKKDGFIDSVQTAYNDGAYKLQLQGNGAYYLMINSTEYDQVKDTLMVDVAKGEYYKEYRKDYELKKLIKPYVIKGYVYDEKTQEPLSVKIEIELPDSSKIKVKSNEDGFYSYESKVFGEHVLRAQKVNYLNLEDKLQVLNDQLFLDYSKDLYMSPIEVGKTVIINNIYFNFDKTSLKTESFPELDRLTELMVQNPGITIEIGGHTDDKGSDEYNLTLSEGRAQSVMQYLLDKGIDQERMKAKGYGESNPISTNANDAGRAENRRVEFTILSVE